MKRRNRIVSVFLTLFLMLAAVAIFAAANESSSGANAEKEAIKEGYFLFYDASKQKFEELENSKIDSTMSGMQDGDVITLLSNVEVKRTAWAAMSNGGTNYIDFNGYRFSAYADLSSHYFLIPKSNTTIYMYSSDDTYKARIFASATSQSSGAETSITFINQRYTNTNVYIGDAEKAPVIKQNGSTWSLVSKTGN